VTLPRTEYEANDNPHSCNDAIRIEPALSDATCLLPPIIAPILTIQLVSTYTWSSPSGGETRGLHLSKVEGPPIFAPTGTGILGRCLVDENRSLLSRRNNSSEAISNFGFEILGPRLLPVHGPSVLHNSVRSYSHVPRLGFSIFVGFPQFWGPATLGMFLAYYTKRNMMSPFTQG
jgi:hypothetical protein